MLSLLLGRGTVRLKLEDFSVISNSGERINLGEFANKVLLIVNTASKCAFTPQYGGLVNLKRRFAEENFEILAFPSNDFALQEPGSDDKIRKFCARYEVNFPLMSKVQVRGSNCSPLFKELIRAKGIPLWNFHKYLIDKEGTVVCSFPPWTDPENKKILDKISNLLNT